MSYIKANNVWMEYGKHVVLERLNLTVNRGEFCTIVGTSGCGKTTFLRMLLGEETPTRGQIILDGNPLPAEPDEHRGIVFQRYSVFPHLTVLNNVMLGIEFERNRFFGKLFGSKRRQAQAEAMVMIEQVGLTNAKNKFPHELSGGMQQRLAIAQSLVKTPRILLLDEPFGALDPGIRADMHELILNLWQKSQLTIFMITHDLKEGFHLGSRLLVFDKLRNDPQAPEAFGATITYDLPLASRRNGVLKEIDESITETARQQEKHQLV